MCVPDGCFCSALFQYLGDTTPQAVREKCILLLFTWQRDLGGKYPKIREAYQMLRSQNVIASDPATNESENDRVSPATLRLPRRVEPTIVLR